MKRLSILIFLAALLLSGCGAAQEPQPQLILRYADNQSSDYPTTMAAVYFSQLVEERTQGRILIRVYADGTLGNENSVLEQVRFGGIDFARVSLGSVTDLLPEMELLQLPYLYQDSDHMWRVLDGTIGDLFLSATRKAGIVGLSWFDAGARSLYTRRPITSLEDLQGLEIRTQESAFMSLILEALGAAPLQIPYGDVYSALQTGKIDGAENNWPSYESTGHYEAAPYFLLDEHCRIPEMQIMSTIALDRIAEIDADYVGIVMSCARESAVYERELWASREESAREAAVAKGCIITELTPAARDAFRQAVLPLYEKYTPEQKALIQRIQAA